MRISKFGGAVLSMVIIIVYSFLYCLWVIGGYFDGMFLVYIFLGGALFNQLEKIDAGTTAELSFLDQATGKIWSNGICFVPKFLPILHYAGIPTGWGLIRKETKQVKVTDVAIKHSHFADQRLPSYQVRTEASLLAMELHRFTTNAFQWFFDFQEGPSELLYRRIGTRLVVLAFIGGCLSHAIDWVTTSFNKHVLGEQQVRVLVSLNEKHFPVYRDLKERQQALGKQQEVLQAEKGGVVYTYVIERYVGKLLGGYIETENVCTVLPLGGYDFAFKAKTAPLFAVNVEPSVEFLKKRESLPFLENFSLTIQDFVVGGKLKQLPVKTSWRELNRDWHSITGDDYKFFTGKTALVKEETKELGVAMICF